MTEETAVYQLPVKPNGVSSIAGAVDKISPSRGIIGWAFDHDSPSDELHVELVSHGITLGSCKTGLSRNDVADSFGLTVFPGFFLPWETIDTESLQVLLKINPDAAFNVEINGVNLSFVEQPEAEGGKTWLARDLQRFAFERKIKIAAESDAETQPSPADEFHFIPHLSDNELIELNFDPAYYRATYPDLKDLSDAALIGHYCAAGWRERRNPSPFFDTRFYFDTNPDLLKGDTNPLIHFLRYGRAEGRRPAKYQQRRLAVPVTAKVSVIVPNYNHARFLPARLDSILDQSYGNIELILLDDCSTDDSVDTINSHLAKRNVTAKLITRETNSGSVFKQWQRGIECATGSLIWICESDDLAELDFLEKILPHFNDSSVMLAFGRIQYCNRAGVKLEGLDGYREAAEAGIWSQPSVRTAQDWFKGAFGAANVIANVGGCVMRNQPIAEEIWEKALKYKILGDWYLYLALAGGGRIAFEPKAVTYFRQHGANTSVKSFSTEYYYREHQMIGMELRRWWDVGDSQSLRLFQNTLTQFRHAKADTLFGSIDRVFDLNGLLSTSRTREHILICFVGFHLGGGELFPINLANEMIARGYLVSALVIDSLHPEQRVRTQLDRRVAVYDRDLVLEIGPRQFLRNAGITMIHSHNVGAEFLFFDKIEEDIDLPYIVTLHGSYEVTPLPELIQLRLLKNVSRWTCLAKNNLKHLIQFPIDSQAVSFVPNGMPRDLRPFPLSRADMGIPDNAVVFTIASRAIAEKGWEIAIQALQRARRRSAVPLFLLLAGSGPEAARLEDLYWADETIRFLGFQQRVCGLYSLSDCVMLPTRFAGESYPLCLIEAMQVGCPIIATNMGEISRMVIRDKAAGIIIEPVADDEILIDELTEAMMVMTDPEKRGAMAEASREFGETYDIHRVADRYEEIYAAARVEKDRRSKNLTSCLEIGEECEVRAKPVLKKTSFPKTGMNDIKMTFAANSSLLHQ